MINRIIKEDVNEILNEPLPWQNLTGKTVLVSGANGFISSYIVEVLLAIGGVRVIALVRNEKKAKAKFEHHLSNKNLNFLVSDVSESFEIDEDIDYIIHAASQASPKYYGSDPVGTLKANTLGTLNMLELARYKKVQKFVFFSTCEVYGLIDKNTKTVDETYTGAFDPTDVRSCYGESKRMGENMCVCYSHQYGINTSIVRPAHTYGPGLSLDDGRVFSDFIKNALNGENIVLNSDGSATRKFLYIADFVRGFFTVLFKGEDKEAYNVTYDNELSVRGLAEIIIALSKDKKLSLCFANDTINSGYIKSKSTAANFISDKLKMLGWQPKIDEKQGFKRMIESYE